MLVLLLIVEEPNPNTGVGMMENHKAIHARDKELELNWSYMHSLLGGYTNDVFTFWLPKIEHK